MGTFIFFGVIALVVVAMLALDWFAAGRKGRRSLMRARDGQSGNADVDYAAIERQAQSTQQQTWTGI